MEVRPGAVIGGKLRLLRPLGQGGMGVVWAARHLSLETDVAVKFVRPERAAESPALLARFEREARATARIAHPHVVKVMDYGVADGAVPYLVMELLRGFSLAELLERGGRLSVATARSLVQQVGSALESAHDHGVVHRDVKPQNVFITEGSQGYPPVTMGALPPNPGSRLFIKVLDFGVAKMLGDTAVPGAGSALTEPGVVVGSAPYMAPEQLEGREDVDLRADLWSLGVIVYEALTGVRPFDGATIVTVGAAVLEGRYRPASTLRPNLPASLDDWFAKALCVDPDGRFPSAPAMVAAFLAEEAPPSLRSPLPGDLAPTVVSAYATTVEAPARPVLAVSEPRPALETGPGATAGHAPLARRPDPPRERPPRRLARIASAAGVLAVAVAGISRLAPSRGAARCPAGMIAVAGATFPMGSAPEAETPSDETPRHHVTVAPFCLDVTEVTVAAYAACTGCAPLSPTVDYEGLTPNGRDFDSQFCNRPAPGARGDHPVNCVDWHQAKAYCAAQNKRLPTEAEWELAARGEEARLYPWGQAPPSGARLNACGEECSRMLTERREAVGKGPEARRMYPDDDGAPATAPVGSHPAGATPAGVQDLAGNVWEWTESAYCGSYDKVDCGDSRRVLRGGGWDTIESTDVRAARRYPSAPTARGRSIGFRCAASRE